jgi:hypothetical protein
MRGMARAMEVPNRVELRGMARAMTVPRQSEVRGSWILSVSLGIHGLYSKWSFRQVTGATVVHVSLLDNFFGATWLLTVSGVSDKKQALL